MTPPRRNPSTRPRPGFTLVELLVVIVIIGILMGLLIPAIAAVRTTIAVGAIQSDLNNLDSAVETYRSKYGEYPPDFSDWNLVRAHYQRVFPDIAASELSLLFALCDDVPDGALTYGTLTDDQAYTSLGNYLPAVMDRAEALVFTLGGYSSDPQHPFTGTGGPLTLIPGAGSGPTSSNGVTNVTRYQYNVDRNPGQFPFGSDRLSLSKVDPAELIAGSTRLESNDEEVLAELGFCGAIQVAADLFPTYSRERDESPVVYFDARTYDHFGSGVVVQNANTGQLNGFVTYADNEPSIIRPVLSDDLNTNLVPGSGGYGSTAGLQGGGSISAIEQYRFHGENTFQILSPGLSGNYGLLGDNNATRDPTDGVAAYWLYPSGRLLVATGSTPSDILVAAVKRFNSTSSSFTTDETLEAYEKDNMANFSSGKFESGAEE